MKRLRKVVFTLICIWLLFISFASVLNFVFVSPVYGAGYYLYVDGNEIKDNLDAVVYLRGWNHESGIETESFKWSSWEYFNQTIVQMTLDAYVSNGANMFRRCLVLKSWMDNVSCATEQGTWTYKQCWDYILQEAESRGIYVVVAPTKITQWQTGQYNDQMGFDPYSNDEDEGIVTSQGQFTDIVASIVTELGDHDNLIMEVWNEPFWGYTGGAICVVWQGIYNEAISKIRATELANGYVYHLILCQLGAGLQYWNMEDPRTNFNWLELYPLTDSADNLIYGTHAYRSWGAVGGTEYPFDDAPYDYDTIKAIYVEQDVKNVSDYFPIYFGEIGCLPNANDATWMANTLQIFNEWNISYTAWTWRQDGGLYAQVVTNSEPVTGGTLNTYGQIVADAIASGEGAGYNEIVRVQGNKRGVSVTSSLGITLDSVPIEENLLVVTIGVFHDSNPPPTVDNITQTGVTWTEQVTINSGLSPDYARSAIWAGVVGESPTALLTINLSGTPDDKVIANVCEYSGLLTSGFLDETASTGTAHTSHTTGTTAVTSQDDELWIGSLASIIWTSNMVTPQNGFTLFDGVIDSEWCANTYLEKIVDSTGEAFSGATSADWAYWAGCIATFKASAAEATYYYLNVSAGSGGTTYPIAGEHAYLNGSYANVEAFASGGYSFANWTLDGGYGGTDNPTSVYMTANHTIQPVFVVNPPPPPPPPSNGDDDEDFLEQFVEVVEATPSFVITNWGVAIFVIVIIALVVGVACWKRYGD